jgi:hypothetical protein
MTNPMARPTFFPEQRAMIRHQIGDSGATSLLQCSKERRQLTVDVPQRCRLS